MDSKPDSIHVSAMVREEIRATHADLFVTVRGSSLVSGNEALKKAKEVSGLVDELTRFGLGQERVHLQGVQVETSSGVLLKSSSAIYRLRLRCESVDQIPALLDIIATQKNAALERIEWKYDEEPVHARGLEAAIELAKAKAEKISAALGVKLLGVYQFNENTFDEEAQMHQPMMMKTMRGGAQTEEPSLGMDIQHSKTVQVNVDIEYRVSGF